MVDAILVLDFGGQYCHLIARRIREHGVYAEIVPFDVGPEQIRAIGKRFDIRGLILSGGPSSIYDPKSPKCSKEILNLGLPLLGICYGHQLIAHLAGGKVRPGKRREYGRVWATIEKPISLLRGLKKRESVWMSHQDIVYKLPPGYENLAHTTNCPIAAFRHRRRAIFGLQWHPEVVHTPSGEKMLGNFLRICGCEKNWRMENYAQRAMKEIREAVGSGKAVVALSGGVDSSTVTLLAERVIGRRLTAIFVDHGFMREGEPEFIERTFSKLNINFIAVNARRRFLQRLKGVRDPEEKRRVIGREFIKVFEGIARRIGAEYLLQGTIYPDRIESGFRKHSDKIKTHHNVAGLPLKIKFKKIIEPLRDLYKDEVRRLAEAIGLPKELVWRQPFPGPGLAVRIIGEVTEEKIAILKKVDRIVREEIEGGGVAGGLWQYFAILTNTKSTGVKGDSRAYGYSVAIRAVESKEAMTARFARIPYDRLERISTRVVNEVPQVTRVVYDITNKPPATIEWE